MGSSVLIQHSDDRGRCSWTFSTSLCSLGYHHRTVANKNGPFPAMKRSTTKTKRLTSFFCPLISDDKNYYIEEFLQ